ARKLAMPAADPGDGAAAIGSGVEHELVQRLFVVQDKSAGRTALLALKHLAAKTRQPLMPRRSGVVQIDVILCSGAVREEVIKPVQTDRVAVSIVLPGSERPLLGNVRTVSTPAHRNCAGLV